MARPKLAVPSYRRHRDRHRDRAFVELDGKRLYLGQWNTPESKAEYERVLAEWRSGNRQAPAVFAALQAVPGLKRGRSTARESEPVRPVPAEHVEAVRPYVSRQVWAIIQLQLLSGARSGELVVLRPCDIDTSGAVWVYSPQEHKTRHHGHERNVYFGPRAQEVLRPFLSGRGPGMYCFSPTEAEEERRAAAHAARKTPMSCGNAPGRNRKKHPERHPRDRYDVESYGHAIARACKKSGIDHWHPLLPGGGRFSQRPFSSTPRRVLLVRAGACLRDLAARDPPRCDGLSASLGRLPTVRAGLALGPRSLLPH